MGVDIARAALAAGHAVVATGRNPERVAQAVGECEDLLAVKLDVTDPADAQAAVQAAVDRFGRIDVLVNNAGNFYAGFFEEITPEDFRAQIETTLFGPINVTRAVLPVMRAQRSGLVVTISSTAGIVGGEFLHRLRRVEVRRRGLDRVADPRGRPVRHPHDARRARILPHRAAHPGVDQLRRPPRSTTTPSAPRRPSPPGSGMNGQQGGDPAKLADALIQLADLDEPPLRFAAGADAVGAVEARANDLLAQADAHRELSSSLALDDA